MDNKKTISIEIPEKLISALDSQAQKDACSIEEVAIKILSNHFNNPEKLKPTKSSSETSFPSVALIKDNFDKSVDNHAPPTHNQPITSLSEPLTFNKTTVITSTQNQTFIETNQRRLEIEAQMKELSLLLTTATDPEKLTEYSLQYALLATELDSII